MQKKRLISASAAAVMALSSAAAVLPASADTAPAVAAASVSVVEASTATIKFNANGGKASKTKKTYKKGTKLGVLPTAKKNNLVFDGWYTKKKGGKRVTADTKLKKCKNTTFYAHYKKVSVANVKYAFSNSYEGFHYTYPYRTPYERYKYVFDEAYAAWAYSQVGYSYWGGNCFGMSSTAAYNASGKTNVQTFNKKALFTKDLKVTQRSSKLKLTVGEYCEAGQLTQLSQKIQRMYNTNDKKYASLVKQVKKCQKGKGAPVVVGVLTGNSGHALLAYRFKKVNAREDRLYIYDCNYPERNDLYITLKKGASGNYTGFKYDTYNDLTFFPISAIHYVWKNRGTVKARGMNDMAQTVAVNVGRDADVYGANGELVASVRDGLVQKGDVSQMKFLADKLDPEDIPAILYLPAGEYTLKGVDGAALKTSAFYAGGSADAEGSEIALKAVNGSIAMGFLGK